MGKVSTSAFYQTVVQPVALFGRVVFDENTALFPSHGLNSNLGSQGLLEILFGGADVRVRPGLGGAAPVHGLRMLLDPDLRLPDRQPSPGDDPRPDLLGLRTRKGG